ncbi:hypothetical protein BC940DRAFT_297271 [Gongronella butleri]|nr:hypothetical protein BC940DRAFT_297271 [Gongronella butleri]
MRLERYWKQCAALGCLSGFKHFEVCMLSQEELLFSLLPAGIPRDADALGSFGSSHLLDNAYIHDKDRTVFLFTGYAIYSCPYVYPFIQSQHQDNVRHMIDQTDKQYPIHLNSTDTWHKKDVSLWEMIWELVSRISWPSPKNPFALDFDYLERLPLPQLLFLSGGLIGCLQSLWIEAEPQTVAFVDDVFQDLQRLQQLHLNAMRDYAHMCNTASLTSVS